MKFDLFRFKDIFWSILIAVSIFAVAIGLIISMFNKFDGLKNELTLNIGNGNSAKSDQTEIEIGTGSGNARGQLLTIGKTEDAGLEYTTSIYYLVDSTFFNLKQSEIPSSHIWTSESSSLPISNVNDSGIIRFPNDGSNISVGEASMIIKPDILLIAIGQDGLSKVSEEEFITAYDTLVMNIQSTSPNTKIMCCALTGVTESYSGIDELNVTAISDGNDWVQKSCRDTGAYFLDIGEEIKESGSLLTRFADTNGKSLNKAGIEEFLKYVQTHKVS